MLRWDGGYGGHIIGEAVRSHFWIAAFAAMTITDSDLPWLKLRRMCDVEIVRSAVDLSSIDVLVDSDD